MKTFSTILGIAASVILTAWCGAAPPAANVAVAAQDVVVIDEGHNMAPHPGAAQPVPYLIKAGPSMTIDASGYTFNLAGAPAGQAPLPVNAILILLDHSHQFGVTWIQGTSKYEISKATLHPLPGSGPFLGFKSGSRILVTIGNMSPQKKISTVWATVVNVR